MTHQPTLLKAPTRTCGRTCRAPSPAQAHCTAGLCHRTFASVADFDTHRLDGHCVHPASLGLVDIAGLWSTQARHEALARAAGILAKARSHGPHASPQPSESPPGTPPGHPRPLQTESEPFGGRHAA